MLLTDSVCEYQPNDHPAQVEECETADAESQVVDAGENQQRREHVPDPDKEGIDRHLRPVLLLGGRREEQDVSHRAVQRIVGGVLGDFRTLDEFQKRHRGDQAIATQGDDWLNHHGETNAPELDDARDKQELNELGARPRG